MSSRLSGPSSALRVLRMRNFGPYFVGNALSASGTWFQNLAAGVFVYRTTHSALLLGVLAACQFGPVLLLAPWSGRIADAFDRRRLLLVTQPIAGALSAALAGLVWQGIATPALVIAFATMMGVITGISIPAQMALVGSLVPRADLPRAVALNSMTFNLARALGPAAAAATIALSGIAAAFAVNAVSFLAFVVALLLVTPTPVPPVRRTSIRDSVAMVRTDPRLLGYLGVVMAVGMTSDPINTESPAIAHAFGFTPVWGGAVIGCFGLGAVLAAVASSERFSGDRQMAASLVVFGGGIVLMAVSPWFPLALAFVIGAGFGYLSANAAATTRLQLGVDDEQRGRVMALWSVAFLGARPLASLVDGALASVFGVRVAAAVLATPVLVAALVLMRSTVRSRAPEPARG
jgi:MFS family permease